MNKNDFIEILRRSLITYRIDDDDSIIIEGSYNLNHIFLGHLKSLPDRVQFNNEGIVYLDSLSGPP